MSAGEQASYFDLKNDGPRVRAGSVGRAGLSVVWACGCLSGQGSELGQVVREYPVAAPDGGPLLAVQAGPVPAVASFEV
jgi:hypothetical protein